MSFASAFKRCSEASKTSPYGQDLYACRRIRPDGSGFLTFLLHGAVLDVFRAEKEPMPQERQ